MKIKAIKPCFYYGGREPGEVFDASGQYGHMLIRMGKAVSAEGKDMQAEGADAKPARTYKRKDMQAEGGAK